LKRLLACDLILRILNLRKKTLCNVWTGALIVVRSAERRKIPMDLLATFVCF
jgi:hypothetical protein